MLRANDYQRNSNDSSVRCHTYGAKTLNNRFGSPDDLNHPIKQRIVVSRQATTSKAARLPGGTGDRFPLN
jgi:hypothetical protein